MESNQPRSNTKLQNSKHMNNNERILIPTIHHALSNSNLVGSRIRGRTRRGKGQAGMEGWSLGRRQ